MVSELQTDIRCAALVGKFRSPEVVESLRLLADFFRQRGIAVLMDEESAHFAAEGAIVGASYRDIGAKADVAIVVGGDGTLLNAARQLAAYAVPLVGVNQGRLGFMTDVSRESMLASMEDLLAGRFSREERFLLQARIQRDGVWVTPNFALNDIVLSKANAGRMIEFELSIDGEFIYVLRADGMIVATPTGSTAYALSANGPVLHPSVAGIAIVPLCPHGLSYRPITVSAASTIELALVAPHDGLLYLDGQDRFDVGAGDRIVIRHAERNIVFLHPPGYSYFAMLREKLHWSATPKRA
ncbi:MAG: NAD(+) kinase [Rhodocyclaceae bacterium]|nr:NAD(+) kinase [Rhodocyclaceae bacterium]